MTIKVPFVKMQALGNSFVIVDLENMSKPGFGEGHAWLLADYRRGIGADQVLAIAEQEDGSYQYRIWNQDGSEVGQCGNGARCIYAYLEKQGRLKDGQVKLRTKTSEIEVFSGSEGPRAFLGIPTFEPEKIPFNHQKQGLYAFSHKGKEYKFGAIGVGNPHACLLVEDVAKYEIEELNEIAAALNKDNIFPEGVNVSFLEQKEAINEINMRVHERGVGVTAACGSAAAAAAAFNFMQREFTSIICHVADGNLYAGWNGTGPAWIEGKVKHIFEGSIEVPETLIKAQ